MSEMRNENFGSNGISQNHEQPVAEKDNEIILSGEELAELFDISRGADELDAEIISKTELLQDLLSKLILDLGEDPDDISEENLRIKLEFLENFRKLIDSVSEELNQLKQRKKLLQRRFKEILRVPASPANSETIN